MGYCRADPAKAFYGAGEVVQVTANAHSGYLFQHWEGSGNAWTSASGGPGNWTVSGDGVPLRGLEERIIYIKMGEASSPLQPEDRSLYPVFCDCIHKGTHHDGSLIGASRLCTVPGILGRYGSDRDEDEGWDDWGCLLYIHKKLKEAAKEWHLLHPENPILFNDISNAGGGYFAGHGSHQNGLDVDIKNQADMDLTNELIGLFTSDGDCTDVFTSNVGVTLGGKVSWEPGHNTHFHVRYSDPV